MMDQTHIAREQAKSEIRGKIWQRNILKDSAMNKGQKKIKVRLEATEVNKMKRRKID